VPSINIKTKLLWSSISGLTVGSLIYLLLRPTTINFFRWIDWLGIFEFVIRIRKQVPKKVAEFDWLKNSLPDGLWIFSYVCIILYVWNAEISQKNYLWFVVICILAIGVEIGQLFNIMPGVYDPIDILFYLVGFFLPFIIFRNSIKLNKP
jgi:hypothetical protein